MAREAVDAGKGTGGAMPLERSPILSGMGAVKSKAGRREDSSAPSGDVIVQRLEDECRHSKRARQTPESDALADIQRRDTLAYTAAVSEG